MARKWLQHGNDMVVKTSTSSLYPEIKEEQEEFKKYFREDCAKFLMHEAKTLGEVKKEFYVMFYLSFCKKAGAVFPSQSFSI